MSASFGQCMVLSAALRGVEALPVFVEVAVSAGLPGMSIVGMPDKAVLEARERVRAAIRNAGFSMPQDKIVVNLAPADVKKAGSGFDLPIALGILAATRQIDESLIHRRLFVGELSLEGMVRPVDGILAYGICAHHLGVGLVGATDCPSVPLDDLSQEGLGSLQRLRFRDRGSEGPFERCRPRAIADESDDRVPDFSDIAGHEVTKRALQIAAAGGHGVLMMGPPGSGKTMLAARIAGILPLLTQEEMMEAAVVHSVAGEDVSTILKGVRPFRQPHHSATLVGLVGGGSPVRPGEISLAHHGILFLDELSEFKGAVLQGIRQPLEAGHICITRADGNVVLPAQFMLVAATNPCPCGYFGDDEHACTCTIGQIGQYQHKIGGPLMDRIDLHLDVARLPPNSVMESGTGTDSRTLRSGVEQARAFARWRKTRNPDLREGNPRSLIDSCRIADEDRSFLESMARAYAMSGRSIMRTLAISRTIADLSEHESVTTDHIAEALGFRLREEIGG